MVVVDTCRPPKWFGKDVYDYNFELFTANGFTDVVADKMKVGETEVLDLVEMDCFEKSWMKCTNGDNRLV